MDVFHAHVVGAKGVDKLKTQKKSVYLDREDAKIIEVEERNLFFKGVLEELGVPLEEVWPDISMTVDQKISFRNLLDKLEIFIIDNGDREYTIYNKDILLAKWYKPKFVLHKDLKAKKLSKKLFYEMIVETWTIFDNKEN